MQRFPSSVVVQREGCGALANLVQLNSFAREELSSQGGIRVVFNALRFLKDSAETQQSGMRLLCGLVGALEDDGSSAASIEEYSRRAESAKPGSREHDELERAKSLMEGTEPDQQADRNSAVQVASFATPLIVSVLETFGFDYPVEMVMGVGMGGSSGSSSGESKQDSNGKMKKKTTKNWKRAVPKDAYNIKALKMAAQALYGLTKHGLHAVVKDAIAPLCRVLKPLVSGDYWSSSSSSSSSPNDLKKKWNPHEGRCASSDSFDFLRFAIGTLHNIADTSQGMRESILSLPSSSSSSSSSSFEQGGLDVPETVAHCMRCCTRWTKECWSRRDMMKRDPLAFVKGGRREGEESFGILALRLQDTQERCVQLMSSLCSVPDDDVRRTMVREGGFEGALYALQYVKKASDSKPLGTHRTSEHMLTRLKATSVRGCYHLLLGVRDPITSLPHFAAREDVDPLINALMSFPKSSVRKRKKKKNFMSIF